MAGNRYVGRTNQEEDLIMQFLQKHISLIVALIALGISGCTSLGLQPLPNPYQDAETNAERAYVTVLAFGAAQDSMISICSEVQPEDVEADTCVQLITAEQTLRPAVTAAARVGAEYMDIDARIKALGPDAPSEWLVIAATSAGDLAEAFDPVRKDVEAFIENAGTLVN